MTSTSFRLLPDHIRDADDGTLQAWLAGAEQALSAELVWLAACDPDDDPPVVQPVHPDHCPAAWLDWLAWLRGKDVRGLTDEQARWRLSCTGRTGSDQGITDAIGSTLTGTRYVRLDHPADWQITATVATTDVVDVAVTLAVAQRHTPAGVNITVSPEDPVTLADLDAAYASLAAIYATGKTLDQMRFG